MRKEKEKINKKVCPGLYQRVVVAMSGGVDSSVAAALLKRAGFDVVGVFMKFWHEPQIDTDKKTDLHRYENRCCSSEAEKRARQVAKILKIPFYVFNFEKEFKKRIVDYFLKENKKGITPNPCVICNKEIKFGLLLKKALELDADFIATGHYARIRKFVNSKQIRYSLISARDKNKDQSYFLWQLSQEHLKRILFPVGDYTRDEVEKLAKKLKLPFKGVKKSQEICFIPNTTEDFLRRHIKSKPSQIITKEGKIIGRHQGLWFYTIGQRKGIGLPGGPYYVLDKDLKRNFLIVTKNERDLYKKELTAKDVHWISGKPPKFPLKIKAKIRYRHKSVGARLTQIDTDKKTDSHRFVKVDFEKSQRAITPGQSIVFYREQELLGGGEIQ